MKMKKMLAALLAAAMSLSLVACGTSNPPANNSGSAGGSGSGTPDPAPSGDKVALNVIAAQYGDLTKDWWAQFQNDFNAANEGIDLTHMADGFPALERGVGVVHAAALDDLHGLKFVRVREQQQSGGIRRRQLPGADDGVCDIIDRAQRTAYHDTSERQGDGVL